MHDASEYLSIMDAARAKRVDRHVILRHARAGRIDVVRIAGHPLVVANARWRQWEPDRARQRAILKGLRKSGNRLTRAR
jgi:hypothetical protein